MNKLVCTAALLAATLSAPAVRAADTFYLGAGIGTRGTLNLDTPAGKIQNTNHPRPLRVFGGYNLTDNFAIEAGYIDFGKYKFSVPSTVDISTFHIAARGNIKFGESWSVFAKAGASRIKVEQTGVNLGDLSDTRPLLGIGAGYAVTKNIALELEFLDSGTVKSEKGKLNLRQVQASVRYTF